MTKSKPTIICISGPSGTGKSTLIENLTGSLYIKGLRPVVMMSPARKFIKKRVSDLRQDAATYLKKQMQIIDAFIARDEKIDLSSKNIYIFDRSMLDNLVYYLLYVNVSELSEEDMHLYDIVGSAICSYIDSFNMLFEPYYYLTAPIFSKKVKDDKIRPLDLLKAQNKEFDTFLQSAMSLNITPHIIYEEDFFTFNKIVYDEAIKNHKN